MDFTRTAVGKHLLLGGDNLDLTLAWLVEAKLGAQFSIRQRSGLRRQCSAAKERAAGRSESEERRDHRAGRGLVADRRDAEDRDHARGSSGTGARRLSSVLRARATEPKEEKRSLFRELGLPYVADPAVTRHLAAFLSARASRRTRFFSTAAFSFRRFCRQRVADVMGHWYGRRPVILENRDLDLAVARRRGLLLVRAIDGQRRAGARRVAAGLFHRAWARRTTAGLAVCLVPRGAEEGSGSKSTRATCNWWPTGRCRSACTAR